MTLEVCGQQVFLIRNYHVHHSSVINPLFNHCTHYSGQVLGICEAYVSAVYLWSHTHILTYTSRHTHWSPWPAVPRTTCVYKSNTSWSGKLLRSQQPSPPPTQPKPANPHLSPCTCQCAVVALLVHSGRRRSNSSMLQRWTRKGDCDGRGLFIDGVWSEQGRGVEEADGGYMQGMRCENKPRGLQTVEPTMVCQIQVCLRFMCPLYKH